jgi:hypothetical protein
MVDRNSTRARRARSVKQSKSCKLFIAIALNEILGRFSEARAVIEAVCLVQENGSGCGDTTSALRTGLAMFQTAYNELDAAIAAVKS